MTAAEPALLRAIFENPDDDTPRLVYADELEATDPARAAFIRVQCELAGVWPDHSDLSHQGTGLCRGCVLRRRERELWVGTVRDQFRGALLIPSSPVAVTIDGIDQNVRVPILLVRRGFVESVTCSFEAWAGGECGRCWGQGVPARVYPDDTPCDACSGTGRTPSLADALLWRAAVTCPGCKGAGECYHCLGTGTVRNPDPPGPGCQPVREVAFTDNTSSQMAKAIFLSGPMLYAKLNYPDITFVLPGG